MTTPKNDLIGKWFLTRNKQNEVEWQGRILSTDSDGLLLIQLYEWRLGEPSGKKLVKLDEHSWTFYDSAEEMQDAYFSTVPAQDQWWK
jgi:hypothetical protein